MRHLTKVLVPLCALGLGLGCEERSYEGVEVGDDVGEVNPVEIDDQQPATATPEETAVQPEDDQ